MHSNSQKTTEKSLGVDTGAGELGLFGAFVACDHWQFSRAVGKEGIEEISNVQSE